MKFKLESEASDGSKTIREFEQDSLHEVLFEIKTFLSGSGYAINHDEFLVFEKEQA